MKPTTTTQQPSLRKIELSGDLRWHKSGEPATSSNSPQDTQTTNLAGERLDVFGFPRGPMIVMQPDDMSGSLSDEDFITVSNLSHFGDRDFIFVSHNPAFIGPQRPTVLFSDKLDGADMRRLQPSIIIWDEAHQYDKALKAHLGPHAEFTESCRPYYEEVLRGNEMFNQKMFMDIPTKCVDWQAPAHKPGETPRGTKPRTIGGIKKTKQQRAATKARRKQR
ncbi:hypothetical protein D3C87_953010 [compost metagenome]